MANITCTDKQLLLFKDRCFNLLSKVVVREQDLLDMFYTLDVNKAVGPDAIGNRVLLAVKN